jgi:hypothetical protein
MSTAFTTPPQTTGHLLLFRGNPWAKAGLSEAEIRQYLDKTKAWFDRLTAAGKLVSAQPLMDEGVFISGKGGSLVTDGPFAEAKEAIGGYVMLSVDTLEEAVEIAKSNPMNDHGVTTEVRPTASSCPHLYRIFSQAEAAVA